MAIEFRCPTCQKLLRVGDDAAGKQAKCPGCATAVTVPSASAAPPPVPPTGAPFGAGAGDPFGAPPSPPPAFASDNPYAAPLSSGGSPGFAGMGGSAGPPWERDGASISSLIATVKEVFSSPSQFFATMRQEGGFGQPLLFYFILNMAALLVGAVVGLAVQGAMFGAMQLPQQQGGGAPPWAVLMGGGAVGVVMQIMFGIVIIPLTYFIASGIFHVVLMVFGGANRPFETTARVVAYSGASAAIGLIPICGGYVQGIVNLVFIGVGLCYAHNTDGWRAALAVITPFVCCAGAGIALAVLLVGSIAAAGGAGGPGVPPPVIQPQPFDPNQFNIEERWRLLPQAVAPPGAGDFNPFADAPVTPRRASFFECFLPNR